MDTNGDGFLSLTEISSTTSLDVSNSSIASLEGIELFTNLTTLDCSYNNLTSLDVSGLKKLQTLRCNNNKLTSLNTSGNGLLSLLNCKTNSLTALNISGNIRLKKLYANGNKFTKLNISASPVLVDTVNEGTRSTMSTYRIYTLDDTGYLSCDTGVTVSTTPEPDLILPTSLTTIGEEAFAGGAFRYVKLSTKVKTIGKRAFADCPNLTDIYIPKTVTSIAADAFEGIGGNLTIHGVSGSTAQTYASSHGYTFTTK